MSIDISMLRDSNRACTCTGAGARGLEQHLFAAELLHQFYVYQWRERKAAPMLALDMLADAATIHKALNDWSVGRIAFERPRLMFIANRLVAIHIELQSSGVTNVGVHIDRIDSREYATTFSSNARCAVWHFDPNVATWISVMPPWLVDAIKTCYCACPRNQAPVVPIGRSKRRLMLDYPGD